MKKLIFTKQSLQNLPKPPCGKRHYIYDDKLGGLLLAITHKGTKSYQVRKHMQGKNIRVTLGRFPYMTIWQARQSAQKALMDLAVGINPNSEKKKLTASLLTLSQIFSTYLKARTLKDGTVKDYQRIMQEAFKDWQNKPLKQITSSDIIVKHQKLGKQSQARANNAMRVLRALFNFASAQYEDENGNSLFPNNPVAKISHIKAWYNVKQRTTTIKPHQLKDWFNTVVTLNDWHIGKQTNNIKDYLLLLLFTGLRRTEGARLEWVNIDFKERTLTVTDTKNHDDHTLPLSNYVFDLLQQRKKGMKKNKYVFPANSKQGYLTNPDNIIRKVRTKSGVYFGLHDLRRTFITIAESLDISPYALKKLVNHRIKSNDVTSGYIIISVDRLRKPMQAIANQVLKQVR